MPERVSVLIVNYNTQDSLSRCLSNLKGTYSNLQVVVVDNGSTDKSAQMVKDNYPWVELVESKRNIGLSAGNNLALSESSGEYLLYLGSDAFPQKETIMGLVNYFENNPAVGIATCKLLLRSGELDWDAHRGFPTPWTAFTHFSGLEKLFPQSRLFGGYFLGFENMEQLHEIDLCISHFMFIRRGVFSTIGNWDENFFVYGEDVDFCYRAKKYGWKVMYLPHLTALHHKGVSVGIRKETEDISTASKNIKRRMVGETTTAMVKFYEKHYLKDYLPLISWIILWSIGLLSKMRRRKY